MADDRPVWVVSDLHLGDGGPTDAFCGKDAQLLDVVARARDAGARLVINGDAIDFHQAGDLTPVVRAHRDLFRALSAYGARGHDEVVYVLGNHDDDLHAYEDLLHFRVCSRLRVGDDVVIEHGHRFDPWIGPNVHGAGIATRVHHAVERALGTRLRLPLEDFYNPANRLAFWLFHKYSRFVDLTNVPLRWLGRDAHAAQRAAMIQYWTMNQAGDPMMITGPATEWARREGVRTIVCGHTHMPGVTEVDGVRYVNTGSWTFGWAALTTLEGGRARVRDVITGREHEDRLYRRLLDGELDALTFQRWWRNEYLGYFRFRSAELRRRRRVASPATATLGVS